MCVCVFIYVYKLNHFTIHLKLTQWCKSAILQHGLPGGKLTYQCRRYKRLRFDSWVGKNPWRKAWQPTPEFLPGESHGQRSLGGYCP